MSVEREVITKFYSAFQNSDAGAMVSCYHPEVEFSDPVFPCLRGTEAMAMWRMLCQRKADPGSRP